MCLLFSDEYSNFRNVILKCCRLEPWNVSFSSLSIALGQSSSLNLIDMEKTHSHVTMYITKTSRLLYHFLNTSSCSSPPPKTPVHIEKMFPDKENNNMYGTNIQIQWWVFVMKYRDTLACVFSDNLMQMEEKHKHLRRTSDSSWIQSDQCYYELDLIQRR